MTGVSPGPLRSGYGMAQRYLDIPIVQRVLYSPGVLDPTARCPRHAQEFVFQRAQHGLLREYALI